MKNLKKHLIFILFLLFLFGASKLLTLQSSENDLASQKTLHSIQDFSVALKNLHMQHPFLIKCLFCASFFLIVVCYIPFVGTVYCLLAGALFDYYSGIIFFSFLVSISYTLSFVISRYFLYDSIQKKMGKRGRILTHAFEKDGLIYLLSLRLCGVVPGCVVNAVMGVTKVTLPQFYFATQLGTLPHVIVAFTTGSKLSQLKSLNDFTSNKFFIFILICAMTPVVCQILGEFILKLKRQDFNS